MSANALALFDHVIVCESITRSLDGPETYTGRLATVMALHADGVSARYDRGGVTVRVPYWAIRRADG
jgi:hypothetical protein